MTTHYEDFYQKLRQQVRIYAKSKEGKQNKWAEYLMLAPDIFHLLCKLTVDPEVSIKDKAKLAAAIAYFVSPLDLIPGAILGPIGLLDDIALAAYVLNGIVNNTSPEAVKRNWAGDEDILEVIKEILAAADEMVGSGLWKKLRRLGGK